jgi:hypothetical protein
MAVYAVTDTQTFNPTRLPEPSWPDADRQPPSAGRLDRRNTWWVADRQPPSACWLHGDISRIKEASARGILSLHGIIFTEE